MSISFAYFLSQNESYNTWAYAIDEDLLTSYNETIRILKADTHTVSRKTMCKQTELRFTSLTPQHLMRSLLSIPLPQ